MKLSYQILSKSQITRALFRSFDRHQVVTKCWKKGEGSWSLEEKFYVEEWSDAQYEFLVKCLQHTVDTGGFVFGVFAKERLIGFASVESHHFGSREQYVQLSCIHVSCESRGWGLGRGLFQCAVKGARRLGAEKLYISAHPAQETQAFYHALGCVEAEEYHKELVESEPDECQLEYVL